MNLTRHTLQLPVLTPVLFITDDTIPTCYPTLIPPTTSRPSTIIPSTSQPTGYPSSIPSTMLPTTGNSSTSQPSADRLPTSCIPTYIVEVRTASQASVVTYYDPTYIILFSIFICMCLLISTLWCSHCYFLSVSDKKSRPDKIPFFIFVFHKWKRDPNIPAHIPPEIDAQSKRILSHLLEQLNEP